MQGRMKLECKSCHEPDASKRSFEPVRMVAIDEDWSALRFRRAEFIKTMTRPQEHRHSAEAKARKGKQR